jgi:23S rRNA G2445 N2-methylase RlmL
MNRRPRTPQADPPCYALTIPGLETVLAAEIEQDLGGDVRRVARGLVVFRPRKLDRSLLELRTAEDVYLLLWGTDSLTHRAVDLDQIRRWTAREPDWPRVLQIHHQIRPRPKGKPTYHLVTQKEGDHAYRRVDALEALAKGLAGKLPVNWRPAEENASVEVWLTIDGHSAICGLRLSDRSMRHRDYKLEHLPASLRPVAAAAMIRLARVKEGMILLDPMCGAGTILAEHLAVHRRGWVLGGDHEAGALRAASVNLRRLGEPMLARWDARRLPLAAACIDRIACNPPFGKQLGMPEEVPRLYRHLICECHRVAKENGRIVLLTSEFASLREAIASVGWRPEQKLRLRILGQPAILSVWDKP